jgi:hypothetical protein
MTSKGKPNLARERWSMEDDDPNKLLDCMRATKSFGTHDEMRRYEECLRRFLQSTDASEFDSSRLDQVLSCMTDTEFGGHGMMDALVSHLSNARPDVLGKALADNFFELRRGAPNCLDSLLSFLLVDNVRVNFESQARSKDRSRQREMLNIVTSLAQESGWELKIALDL